MKTRKDFTTAVHNNESVKITDAGPNWDELAPLLEREFPELRWIFGGEKPTEWSDFAYGLGINGYTIHNAGPSIEDDHTDYTHTTTAQEVIKMLKQNETAEKYKDYAIKCESQEEADKVVELLGVDKVLHMYDEYENYLELSSDGVHFGWYGSCEIEFTPIPASQVISDLSDKFIGDAFEHDGKWWGEVKRGAKVEQYSKVCVWDNGPKFVWMHLAEKQCEDLNYPWIAEHGSGGHDAWKHLATQVAAPAKKVTKLTVSKAGNMMREAGLIEGELAIVEGGV
jgi:hypothetical protein